MPNTGGMAGKKRVSVAETGKLARLVASVPAEVVSDIDDALAAYRRSEGHKVSVSGFVEVALRELLAKSDVSGILKRYGAVAKRTVKEEEE
jgi:hypothetical protein